MTLNVAQMLLVSNRAGATSPITGTPTYSFRSVNFDGISSALYRNDWLANTPDSSVGTISMWVRIDTTVAYGVADGIWGNPNHDVFVGITTNAGPPFIWLQVKNPDVTLLYRINSIAGSLLNNQWCHVLFSWNTNFNVGQKQGAVYINGVNQTDVPVDNQPAFATGYQSGPGAFGWTLGGGGRLGQAIKGDIGNFMMWTTMEVVQPGNTINAGDLGNFLTSGGAAVSNKVAELAYGMPAVDFHGDAVSFPNNRGYGGAFQTQGPFTSSIYAATIEHDYLTGNLFGSGLTTVRNSVAYADDTSGNWTAFPANTPRITSRGLLVEEARTNSIRNNSMQGAVNGTIGAGGALPTNWGVTATLGLSVSVVGLGTESGIDYVDVWFKGTTSSAGNIGFSLDTTGSILASQNQVWSNSLFVVLMTGSLAGLFALNLDCAEVQSGVQHPIGLNLGAPGAVPLRRNRRANNGFTLSQANTASIQPRILIGVNAGAAIDFTLRLGWPQLEQGAFATSPIRTTSAAVTRAADAINATTPPTFGPSYSMFFAGTPISPLSALNQYGITVYAGASNWASIGRSGAGGGGAFHFIGSGTGVINAFGPVWNQGAVGKGAGALAVNDQQGAFNGIFTGNNASGTPAVPTTISIGSGDPAGSSSWSGYITRVAVWPTMRLPNGYLTAMTS